MKKTIPLLPLVILPVLLFAACALQDDGSGTGAPAQSTLPPDQIRDVPRSAQVSEDGEFDFQSLLTVDLSLSFLPHQEPEARAADSGPPAPLEPVVRLTSSDDKTLFTGKADRDGKIRAKVALPSSTGAALLTVSAPGYASRQVEIENMKSLQKLDRTMHMEASGKKVVIGGDKFSDTQDSDGDLVPDVYDAFPKDAERAFLQPYPPEEPLPDPSVDRTRPAFTVAFEDNYPGVGDADYNDFVALYGTYEELNADLELVRLWGTVIASARAAGFDHEFGFMFRFPGGHCSYYEIWNLDFFDVVPYRVIANDQGVDDALRLVIFPRTRDAFTKTDPSIDNDNGHPDDPVSWGHVAGFVMEFDPPLANRFGTDTTPPAVDTAPYDPYLLTSKGFDVHLLGREPLPDSSNTDAEPPVKGFRDKNGFPRALLVPFDWAHPIEQNHIENAYSGFESWRDSGGRSSSGWYFDPTAGEVVPPVYGLPAR